VLGLTVEAQNDLMGAFSYGATAIPIPGEYTGTLYLLTDGHGSTRAVVSGSGVVEQMYNYGDFGSALDFDPSAALTTWLYGNGGYYDAANSLTEDGVRWLNGFWFTQADYGSQMAIGGYGNNLDPITLNNYLFGGADPVMMSDPTGHWSATLGTAVHTFLSREFEERGAFPGSDRFGNRRLSTIFNTLEIPTSTLLGPVNSLLRPDAVEVYYNQDGERIGDVYEFKPGPITSFTSLAGIRSVTIGGANQIGSYLAMLNEAPGVQWEQGTDLWPGFKGWPAFTSPLEPPGTELVTFNAYSIVPGVILYDFLPTQKALEMIGSAAGAATAAAAVYAASLLAASSVAADGGGLAELGASLGIGLLSSSLGGIA
jgi:hypothetical protein